MKPLLFIQSLAVMIKTYKVKVKVAFVSTFRGGEGLLQTGTHGRKPKMRRRIPNFRDSLCCSYL